jgi:hypothetical protein
MTHHRFVRARLTRAAAALAVFATSVVTGPLAAPAPAAAAPLAPPSPPASSRLCTTEEWRQPGNDADCTARLRADMARRAGCVTAPVPDSPDAGLPGWFISRPAADLRDGYHQRFTEYGLGGYHLQMYDDSCAGTLAHPEAAGQNAIADMEFTATAAIIAAAAGLRDRAYDPAGTWGWSDGLVGDVTDAMNKHILLILGPVMLAAVGLLLLWRARRGDLADTLHTAGWAILVLVALTALVRWPVAAAHGTDRAGTGSLAVIHDAVGPPPHNTPPDQCPTPENPDACIDHRTVSVRASDTVVDAVLYTNWLRAELGSSTSQTARTYGPPLYRAATLSWADQASIQQDPKLRTVIIAEKQDRWTTIAAAIKTEDPEAYAHLQGLRGSDRVGAGFVALLGAVAFAAFDITASIMILLAFLVFRIAIMTAPMLGTIGILEPASAMLRRVVNAAIASAINIVVFATGAGLYLTLTTWIFTSPLPGPSQLIAVAGAAVVCWLILRPMRKLGDLVTGRRRPDVTGGITAMIIRGVRRRRSGDASTAAANDSPGPPGEPPTTRPATNPGTNPGTVKPRPETATVTVPAAATARAARPVAASSTAPTGGPRIPPARSTPPALPRPPTPPPQASARPAARRGLPPAGSRP